LVVGRSGWNPGIVGIVAAKLVKRFQCPVAVVGFDADGQGRGSVRGPEGYRLHDALSAASSVLERFGGHQAAAGLEVRADRIDELREHFERVCEAQACTAATHATGSLGEVYALSPEDDLASVLVDLERLEPCGTGNPVPRWVVQAGVTSAREVRGGHLKLDLTLARGQRLAGFAPSLGDHAGALTGSTVLVGTLHRDTWRGGDAAEIKVERILS
jgi:single-stranded-DNA-specific exonuclease